jgi:hypothetical protein
MSLQREDFIKAVQAMRDAKNNLVMSAMILDQSEHFSRTVAEIKQTIGDLEVSIKLINDFNGN